MGEYMVQTWNGFSSNLNVPLAQRPKYLFNKDLKQLILPTSLFSYAITHILEFIKIRNKIKKQSKLMTKKWEYFQEESYMNKIISEIRGEYNIQIVA